MRQLRLTIISNYIPAASGTGEWKTNCECNIYDDTVNPASNGQDHHVINDSAIQAWLNQHLSEMQSLHSVSGV